MVAIRDLTGQKFGFLTVESFSHSDGHSYWNCVCRCGKKVVRLGSDITRKRGLEIRSCSHGCFVSFKEYSGQRFGKLVAIKYITERNKQHIWLWQCDCGNAKELPLYPVKFGNTKSCGCLRNYSGDNNPNHKHGNCYSKEYSIWSAMKRRCKNPGNKAYKYYGGRGITVCERWLNSFDNFYADLGPIPSEKHSLDRIDVNKNYEPSNCRWATQSEQVRNSRVREKSVSGQKGVTFDKAVSKWASGISVNGKWKSLGRFLLLEDAIEARKQAEQKYWGSNET
jgi:hypothetical protein